MSISKSYNKQNGVTYVYEVTENYWDKDKKRPCSKRKLIGKIDPETNEIVPTSRKRASKITADGKDYQALYEKAVMETRQAESFFKLKNELKTALTDDLSYLEEIEHEVAKRKKYIKSLLRKVNSYG